MAPEFIEGDVAFVDLERTPDVGDLVVYTINGRAVVGQIPKNDPFPGRALRHGPGSDIEFTNIEDGVYEGVVVEVRRRVRGAR